MSGAYSQEYYSKVKRVDGGILVSACRDDECDMIGMIYSKEDFNRKLDIMRNRKTTETTFINLAGLFGVYTAVQKSHLYLGKRFPAKSLFSKNGMKHLALAAPGALLLYRGYTWFFKHNLDQNTEVIEFRRNGRSIADIFDTEIGTTERINIEYCNNDDDFFDFINELERIIR